MMPKLPGIRGVSLEEIRLAQSFEQAAARFARDEGTVVLLSGSDQDCARYHILAAWPWLTLTTRGQRAELQCLDHTEVISGNPFDLLQTLVCHFQLSGLFADLPVAAGLFGYFSYDLKDQIEDLPRTCEDTGLPDLLLYAPSLVMVQDRQTGKTTLCMPEPEGAASSVSQVRDRFFRQLDQPWEDQGFRVDARGLTSCYTKAEYVRAVNRIIAYLKAGDIYQANLSQRFETGFEGDAYGLFLELFRRNPAAFFSYIHARGHAVVSTSPERFVQLSGTRVETRPIKGTLARGTDPESDRRNGETLFNSPKDDAELTMIVDLMRNDLSRVTVHDSVIVTEHKRLEPYDNVFHLVSVVEGQMQPGKTAVDLIRATFPGGSITGCPKIRAMEIIDELEPVRRHVYTGSIGYISFHGTMDLSIAIRTATIRDGHLCFSVGGGIVYDSDPEKEFQETLDKGKTLMDTLRQAARGNLAPPLKAWVNGKLTDQDRAAVPAASPGFQYGAGLFETLRVDHGRPVFLQDHVRRMNAGWHSLFRTSPPDLTWDRIIDLLIRENGLENEVCAVKLLVAKSDRHDRDMAAAFIRPYVHRLEALGKAGLDLGVFPEPRASFLADYKSLNYLFYERAGAWAREQGKDEALVLNPDFTVSETNTANIFAVDGNTLILPLSDHVLPGVALGRLGGGLKNQGFEIQTRKLTADTLAGLPNVLLSNALMGVVKVLTIDGRKVFHEPGLCERLNRMLM